MFHLGPVLTEIRSFLILVSRLAYSPHASKKKFHSFPLARILYIIPHSIFLDIFAIGTVESVILLLRILILLCASGDGAKAILS